MPNGTIPERLEIKVTWSDAVLKIAIPTGLVIAVLTFLFDRIL